MRARCIGQFLSPMLLLPALVLTGCGSRHDLPLSPAGTEPAAAGAPREVVEQITSLRNIAAGPEHGLRSFVEASGGSGAGHGPVVVPAGSVDALAAAIASAGPSGTVILATGLHTEHSMVTITRKVSIVGQNGAVLESGVAPTSAVPSVVDPALYVHGVGGVTIWNLTMKPIGSIAGTAILLEDAPRTTVAWNSISGFQLSVLLQNADASVLVGNTVVVNPGWLVGNPPECDGIINMNGAGVRISDNDVSGGLLNMFCSGSGGSCLNNRSHGGFVGIILCRVPYDSFLLPSGVETGSDISATSWLVEGNAAPDNFYTGLLVIDGASHNRLVNNAGSGNGGYDIELLGVTCLFGFETPTSFENQVLVGSHAGITINDFGQDNTITGSATVTHNHSAPCSESAGAMRPLGRVLSRSALRSE